jgi:hypothetical protein
MQSESAIGFLGHRIGESYIQAVGQTAGRLYSVIDDVAMTIAQAEALASGRLNLTEIIHETSRSN